MTDINPNDILSENMVLRQGAKKKHRKPLIIKGDHRETRWVFISSHNK